MVEVFHATVQTLVGSLSQPLSLIPSSLTHFSTIVAAGSPINLEGFHPRFGKVRAPRVGSASASEAEPRIWSVLPGFSDRGSSLSEASPKNFPTTFLPLPKGYTTFPGAQKGGPPPGFEPGATHIQYQAFEVDGITRSKYRTKMG